MTGPQTRYARVILQQFSTTILTRVERILDLTPMDYSIQCRRFQDFSANNRRFRGFLLKDMLRKHLAFEQGPLPESAMVISHKKQDHSFFKSRGGE